MLIKSIAARRFSFLLQYTALLAISPRWLTGSDMFFKQRLIFPEQKGGATEVMD